MQQQPGEIAQSSTPVRMPSRLREISALASRLRLVLDETQENKHTWVRPARDVIEVLLGDPPSGDVMTVREDWHQAYCVVMRRLGKLLAMGIGPLDVMLFHEEGKVNAEWLGDGKAIVRARQFLRLAEMLVSDYRAVGPSA